MLILVIWQWPQSGANTSGQGVLFHFDRCGFFGREVERLQVVVRISGHAALLHAVSYCEDNVIHLEERDDCYIILITLIPDFCLLEKSCLLESIRIHKMFSVVNNTDRGSVGLGTGCTSVECSREWRGCRESPYRELG